MSAQTPLEHLAELRRRLITVIFFTLVATVLSYPIAPKILLAVKANLLPNTQLIVLSPQEAVMTYLYTSICIGLAIAFPVIVYQAWAFAKPALKRNEKNFIVKTLAPAVFLFILGVLFAYKIMLPIALKLLLSAAYPIATPMLGLGETMSFVFTILLAFGLVFQLPLLMVGLTQLGIVDHKILARGRSYAIVGIFLLAGMITPDTSVVPQVLMALPLVLLYEVGIIASKHFGGRRC